MTDEQCEAVRKLREWLAENEKTQAWLARICGVKEPSVHAWMTRTSRPVTYLREVIEAATEGHVTATDWELPSERAKRDEAIRQIQAEAQELPGDAA